PSFTHHEQSPACGFGWPLAFVVWLEFTELFKESDFGERRIETRNQLDQLQEEVDFLRIEVDILCGDRKNRPSELRGWFILEQAGDFFLAVLAKFLFLL